MKKGYFLRITLLLLTSRLFLENGQSLHITGFESLSCNFYVFLGVEWMNFCWLVESVELSTDGRRCIMGFGEQGQNPSLNIEFPSSHKPIDWMFHEGWWERIIYDGISMWMYLFNKSYQSVEEPMRSAVCDRVYADKGDRHCGWWEGHCGSKWLPIIPLAECQSLWRWWWSWDQLFLMDYLPVKVIGIVGEGQWNDEQHEHWVMDNVAMGDMGHRWHEPAC